ncbi:MAG: molybdate ABC transporter permease subunit [Bifidobacteriaceae bacterium]|jgi:molybdate transport system permease protein|nr:molybdate ABC transporter permease subunit [Bifidobacteriaceae bacterium]
MPALPALLAKDQSLLLMTGRPPPPPWWITAGAALGLVLIAAPLAALAGRVSVLGAWRALGLLATRQALWLSIGCAVSATLVALCLGLPLALWLASGNGRRFALVRSLVLLPMVLPPLVSGMALLYLWGRRGALGPVLAALGVSLPFSTAAVIVAQSFVAVPFVVMALEGALLACGGELTAVAATFGAAPFRVLRTITLPLIGPALRSGALLGFARALGEFGATALFAGNAPGITRTMPLAIYTAFNGGSGGQAGANALALVLLVVAAGVMLAAGLWRSPRSAL